MSIIYLGKNKDIETLHLQPGSSWRKSEEGLDILSETYSGPIPAYEDWFRRNGEKGTSHPDYQSMYLVGCESDLGRAYAEVSCTWMGRKNDLTDLQTPIISKRTGIKTATFQTDTPEPATREVSFIGPELVLSYASEDEVVEPQYDINTALTKMADLKTDDESAFKILRSVTTTEEGVVYYNTVPAGLFAALFRVPGWYHMSLESNQIKHTPYWTNQEVWAFEYAPE
jgi:hypothetical protein